MSLLKAAKNYSSIVAKLFKTKGLRHGTRAAFSLFAYEVKRKLKIDSYKSYLDKEESLFESYYTRPSLDEPLISICIPAYKPSMKYLARAIESIERQTYANWQICIADDNSCFKELDRFIAKLIIDHGPNKVRAVQRSENGNISKCTNSAIDISTGDYILLLDQDDVLSKHTCHCLMQTFAYKKNCQLVYSAEELQKPDQTE